MGNRKASKKTPKKFFSLDTDVLKFWFPGFYVGFWEERESYIVGWYLTTLRLGLPTDTWNYDSNLGSTVLMLLFIKTH